MIKFEFSTAQKIIFGSGSISQIGKLASVFGKKCLLIYSQSAPWQQVQNELIITGLDSELLSVSGEPSDQSIQTHIEHIRSSKPELIIAIGGGSTLDFAKAVSALVTNPGDLFNYLEVVGKNEPIKNSPIPLIAIPTTAGTGTEVTKNAVLKIEDKNVKVSLRSEKMIPRLALIDPELTLSLSPETTASTGMDALVQLVEPFLSIRANSFTDSICREGIARIADSLPRAFQNPSDLTAREDMSYCSLSGGIALANAGLGAVHGFAAVLGGMYPIPHGVCCARLLPSVFKANHLAMRSRESMSPIYPRFAEISKLVTHDQNGKVEDGILWFERLCESLNIPRLSSFGIQIDKSDEIIEKVNAASSTKANPIQLTNDELNRVLEESI